jgi:hypothetical protein
MSLWHQGYRGTRQVGKKEEKKNALGRGPMAGSGRLGRFKIRSIGPARLGRSRRSRLTAVTAPTGVARWRHQSRRRLRRRRRRAPVDHMALPSGGCASEPAAAGGRSASSRRSRISGSRGCGPWDAARRRPPAGRPARVGLA